MYFIAQDDQRRRGVHRGRRRSVHGCLSCRRVGMGGDRERGESRHRGHGHPADGSCR